MKLTENKLREIIREEIQSLNEAGPKIKVSKEEENLIELRDRIEASSKGGSASRYSKEFDKEKAKALKAINQMISYTKIGG